MDLKNQVTESVDTLLLALFTEVWDEGIVGQMLNLLSFPQLILSFHSILSLDSIVSG
jgi:hypothetical protein